MGHGLLGPSKGDYHFWKSLEIIWNFNWFKTKKKKTKKRWWSRLGHHLVFKNEDMKNVSKTVFSLG